MNKTVFILICIVLLLFMLFVPNYCAPDTPDAKGKWEWSDMGLRAMMFATIVLPTFFIIVYSNNYEFNVAPTYLGTLERKNLWGTGAFVVLCASSVLYQFMGAGHVDKYALDSNLILFSVVASLLLAIRSLILDGLWGIYLGSNFADRITKFFRGVIILLFVVAVASAFALPLLNVSIPTTAQIDQLLPDVKFVVNEDFTATFCMLLVAGALALVVVVFVLNQVLGLFGGFAAAAGEVARGDFSGAAPRRTRKISCYNCKSFHLNNQGKPSCYTCGRLYSTTKDCPYYDER